MAKAPSAKVSKSSGQGVSRLSYQKGRSLGNKGSASPGDTQVKMATAIQSNNDFGKTGKVKYPEGINVSYGNTFKPTDLKDVQALGKVTPPKGLKTGYAKQSKKLK